MKVYDIEFYGKVTYNKKLEIWKSITPIEILFNGKNCSLDFYIEDATPLTTQYNFDKTSITLEPFIMETEQKRKMKQKQLFDKYLKDPKIMMELFEGRITRDFFEERENLLEDESYCVKHFGTEITERIRTADTREKILDMVHFKELTLATNQIRITGQCDYCDIDYGVSISFDGTIYVGSVEMIY